VKQTCVTVVETNLCRLCGWASSSWVTFIAMESCSGKKKVCCSVLHDLSLVG